MIRAKHRFTRRKVVKKPKTLKSKVTTLSRMVKMNKPEIKYVDLSNSQTVSYNTTTLDLTASIAQALTDNGGRIGDKIRLIGYQVRYSVASNSVFVASAWETVRVLFVNGHGENTSALNMANVLQTTGNNLAYLSPYQHDQRSKFTVRYDKTHTLAAGTALPGWPSTQWHKHFGKLNLLTSYNAAGTSVINNGFYCMLISDTLVNNPSFIYYIRVWYTDA